jgi:hypothetical protein
MPHAQPLNNQRVGLFTIKQAVPERTFLNVEAVSQIYQQPDFALSLFKEDLLSLSLRRFGDSVKVRDSLCQNYEILCNAYQYLKITRTLGEFCAEMELVGGDKGEPGDGLQNMGRTDLVNLMLGKC